jgi:uncharacterized protein (DUF1800 family)
MMETQDNSTAYANAAHLLRRAGFGSSSDDVEAAVKNGLAATTDSLINYTDTPDNIDDEAILAKLQAALPEQVTARAGDRLPTQLIKIWWAYRMVGTSRPLQEKMTLFWHNHFTSKDQGFTGDVMYRQNQLYREHALGNFRTLTLAVAKDPEMLRYLNGNQNYKAHPNENFARELMELFTCGRVNPSGQPNYTEDDVKAGARAFSGWNSRGGEFYYNGYQHDDTVKTFMGQTGNFNGDDIIDILVALPSTADYICRKLFHNFGYENPEPEVMNALISTYYGSGYDIKAVVSLILKSNAFYSPQARYALIKSPVQFVVGSVKMARISSDFTPAPDELTAENDVGTPLTGEGYGLRRRAGAMGLLAYLVTSFRSMGQDILEPPSVKGWDGGTYWINTDSLQARAKFAANLSRIPDLPVSDWTTPSGLQNADFSGGSFEATAIMNQLLWQFGPLNPTAQDRQLMSSYAQTLPSADLAARALVSLILSLPDYQVC